MTDKNVEAIARKMRIMLAMMDMGEHNIDPLELLWAAGVFKEAGELKLARECERRARRSLPNLSRDLS